MTDRPAVTAPPPARRPADRLHLSPRHRTQLEALLREHLPGVEVWVYGSRITGESHDGSDLDLVLRAPGLQKIPVGRLSDLWEALRESTIPFLVEARDWARLPEGFHGEIERDYVVLLEQTKQHDDNGRLTTTLGDVITLKRGYDLSRHERVDGPVPVVSSSGIIDYHSDSKVSGPGVVTGRYGTLGQVFFIPTDFWPLNTALYVQDFKGNDPRFIAYFLRTLDFSAYSDKAAVPGLNRNHLHQESVRIPTSVSEQRAIAHVLGTLDDKIELNRRMNETLEAMARALFQSWFVDFDPVRAKMEGRDTGLPKDIANLFPDRLVITDSEHGEIPEGWKTMSLGECYNLTMGQSPPGNTYNDQNDGLPFFQGRTDFGVRFPENRKFCTAPTRIAQPGDTLVSVRAPVGDINMAWERCCIGRGVAALRHKSGSSSFTYYSILAVQNKISLYEHTGTVFGAINRKQFEELTTLEPEPDLINAFDVYATPVAIRIRSNVSESRTFTALREATLPKLISGAVRLQGMEYVGVYHESS